MHDPTPDATAAAAAPAPLAVVAAVIRRGDRFLVCRRPPGGAWPGAWEFPGGKVRAGETPAAALERELREELALAARVGPLLFAHDGVDARGRAIRLLFHEVTIGVEPALLHHDALCFATRAELTALDLLPGDRAFAARIATS
jgi:8-oxo-dGTP pyrophosphatase MutT (NUDIX family)